jgi:SRSO17 transposase
MSDTSLQCHFAAPRFTLPSGTNAGREVAEMGGELTEELGVLDHWGEALAEVRQRIAPRFRRMEVRERAGRYLAGLFARVERKNGWQLAEAIGEADPHGVQRLLNEAAWDADGVRDDLRAYVVEHLGDAASGVLIVDETGFLKKGTHSCGVARQYCGTAGTTANAQIGVFLAYASGRGTAFIDRARYLPRAWARDRKRRADAGIPKGTRFATKITLAKRLLTRAFAAGVPARWVVADSFYGRSHAFRRWLEQRGRPYVLMVPKTTAVEYQGRRERAEQLGARLPDEAWCSRSAARVGEAGEQQWVCLVLANAGASGMGRWLLVRRDAADPGELAYHLAYGPAGTTPAELLRVCDVRWQIEEGFAQAKGELGLDQYEVLRWDAWHRFVTLCLLAHAYLAVLRLRARAAGAATEGAADAPDLLPLTVPEVRRLVLALAGGAEQRTFRLGWSRWRRRHQATAARSHAARRGRDRRSPPTTPLTPPPAVPGAGLTDAAWALVQPLIPPQRPPTGRPRHDHRPVLSGIVWVIRRRESWRAVPRECGKWAMVYKRYQLWRAEGRWPRIAAALGLEDREVAL